jgi:hypothetical protein
VPKSLESLTVKVPVGTLLVTLELKSHGGSQVVQCNACLIPTTTPAHASALTSEDLWESSGIACAELLPAMQRVIFQLMFVALYEHIKDTEPVLGGETSSSSQII